MEDEENEVQEDTKKVSALDDLDCAVEDMHLKEVEFMLGDKAVFLRELNGTQRDAYLTDISKRMKYQHGEVVGYTTFDGHQANLIVKCLYDKTNGNAITLKEIRDFPARVQSKLFDAAQELSGLDIEAKEAAKND